MEKLWKIKNITQQNIKISVSVKSNVAPGVILKPGEFCIARQQMTSPLDKQLKTKKVEIEDFENTQNLELAKAYKESILDIAESNTKKYSK
jgi:hypothetical protein